MRAICARPILVLFCDNQFLDDPFAKTDKVTLFPIIAQC